VKVRIFQPKPMTTSFQSLSSDDEPTGWELATEPHVARVASKLSRSSTYMGFADDESSESSVTGTADNCIIQGTFTSSDYLRIRWATPLKDPESPSDGRRRVGVKDVEGNMTCTILEKLEDGSVKMRLDYQGTCTGVWFPGVATMLGMDVLLDKHGSRCLWPNDSTGQWTVDGDAGFTGFNIGKTMLPTLSREPSLETPHMTFTGLPQGLDVDQNSPTPSRTSSMSSSSLLRAPLPQRESTPEYSFEDSAPTTPGMLSSVAYTHSSVGEFGLSAQAGQVLEPPTQQITVHVNMNELQAYPKNKFIFNISGTVIMLPSLAESDIMADPNNIPIVLPVFCVQKAETQSTTVTVRSLVEDSTVEVSPGTSVSQFQFGKKTVLQTGSQAKCGSDGAMILVKPRSTPVLTPNQLSRTISQTPRTPLSTVAATDSMILDRSTRPTVYRDGPLVIPWVTADVVPHATSSRNEWMYSVKVVLPTPVDAPSDWIEFGLAMPPSSYASSTAASVSMKEPPRVSIACASIDGIPVRFETFAQLKPELDGFAPEAGADQDESKRKWLTWVRVYSGNGRYGTLRVDYSVSGRLLEVEDLNGKGKKKEGLDTNVNVFLPMFSLSVASYDVVVKQLSTLYSGRIWISYANSLQGDPARDKSNISALSEKEDLYRAFNVEPFTYQHVIMDYARTHDSSEESLSPKRRIEQTFSKFASFVPVIAILFLLVQVVNLRLSNRRVEEQLARLVSGSIVPNATDHIIPLPIPTTTPASAEVSSTDRWWHGGGGGLTHTLVVPSSHVSSQSNSPSLSPSQTSTPIPTPESTPVESDHDEDDEDDSDLPPPLVPSIYVPISWLLQHTLHIEQMKEQVASGWAKLWRVVDIVLNWPLGPSH
jgi:hypothetical protein